MIVDDEARIGKFGIFEFEQFLSSAYVKDASLITRYQEYDASWFVATFELQKEVLILVDLHPMSPCIGDKESWERLGENGLALQFAFSTNYSSRSSRYLS